MAEEAMVIKEFLTDKMIEAGSSLTHLLDKSGLVVKASLWLYISESNQWRLIIGSPSVKEDGPRKVYERIHSTLLEVPEDAPHIPLFNISAVEDDDQLISLLRLAINTGDGISGIRFSGNAINGHYIEDAYIYRVT